MGMLYGAIRLAFTMSTTNDLFTIETTASGAGSIARVKEFMVGGQEGSSSVCQFAVARPSAAPTGAGTAITLRPFNPASAAASVEVNSTYATTQPTVIAADGVLAFAFNGFGGVVRWTAPPDGEIVVGAQGAAAYLSFRSMSGTPAVSGHVVVEQM